MIKFWIDSSQAKANRSYKSVIKFTLFKSTGGRFRHADEEENLSQSARFKFHDGKGGSGGLSWVSIIMGQWSLSRGDMKIDQSKLKEIEG